MNAIHAARPVREPDLRVETRVVSEPQPGGRYVMSGLLSASFLLHATLLLAVIVVPLVTSEAPPPPVSGVKAFFVAPAVIAPPAPPPPPPPPASAPRIRPSPPAPESRVLRAPVETPDRVIAEAVDGVVPAADAGGDLGGVEGGVPGGVVGGVFGGLPEPPPPSRPLRVGGLIKEPTKRKHVAPVYPDIAVRANIQGSVVLECIVSPRGQVTDVKVLRGIPVLNAAAVEAVKQWEYTPTLRDGVPVPVIFTVTVEFRLE